MRCIPFFLFDFFAVFCSAINCVIEHIFLDLKLVQQPRKTVRVLAIIVYQQS